MNVPALLQIDFYPLSFLSLYISHGLFILAVYLDIAFDSEWNSRDKPLLSWYDQFELHAKLASCDTNDL